MRMGPKVPENLRTDHKGRVFASQKEMLVYWKVPKGTFDGRMRKGWNMHDCLVGRQVVAIRSDSDPLSRTDFEGRVFRTTKEMVDYWKVPIQTFEARRAQGWTLKECLTGREYIASGVGIEKRTDHEGNVYPSVKAMCDHYGRTVSSYFCALSRGKTKREALLGIKIQSKLSTEERTDHKGQVFPSVKEMCEHWGLNVSTYKKRIADGWSKEKALSAETRSTDYSCQDHLGNWYENTTVMCEHYNIYVETYRQRIRHGYSVQAALLTPIQTSHYAGWKCISFVYESEDKTMYFLCRKGNTEEVLSKAELEAKVK